ncbi:fumarylacetoacetate hydrolase family protein [Sphingorhabdus sp.]|jgi:2-keto-4-pentenoate hydratase/2-oxohepta-3-ene-1,7-dioic acid hydratase in catechol pathway|uniref:fumarylacetoacetate hydrolase family protein n=1 Tax=Sphingorhabdus sp. TaxID=1902408 RepID=UPI0038FBF1FB
MRLARVTKDGKIGLAAKSGDTITMAFGAEVADLDAHIAAGSLAAAGAKALAGEAVAEPDLTFLPLASRPSKIICLGLNYRDHAEESGLGIPQFPVLFARFPSSLIGHNAPIILPKVSEQLDWEAELVVILGKGGKCISEADALDHVAGYSVFNDASIRDYQIKTPQWTAGKNFDDTGAIGPWLVTPDEIPAGAAGLKIECRLDGVVMQSSNTSNLIFDVANTIHLLSGFMTLEAGDLLVMGTPGGVGIARNPQVWMKAGQVCEVEIEGVGLLVNPIVAE